MITQIIWLLTLPVVMYFAYRMVLVALKRAEKNE